MKQVRFSLPHRIFVASKAGKTVFDEVSQFLLGLLACDRKTELIERAGMRAEAVADQLEHLLGEVIRRKLKGRANLFGAFLAE